MIKRLLITGAAVLFISSAAKAEIEVRLRPRAAANGTVIHLGDVAEIVGAGDADTSQLAATSLMPAPAPGTQRFVRRREIEDLLAAQGVYVRNLQLVGATQVAIVSARQFRSASDEIAEEATHRTAMHAQATQVAETATRKSPTQANDGASVSPPVVVATQNIPRGAIITAATVEARNPDQLTKLPERRGTLEKTDSLIGMEAKQSISAGDVVYSDSVQSPVVVKRGDLITVTSQAGGIRVKTTARARQDAARGDLVQVESLQTRERYDVRATGLREAAIFAVTKSTKPRSAESVELARRSAN